VGEAGHLVAIKSLYNVRSARVRTGIGRGKKCNFLPYDKKLPPKSLENCGLYTVLLMLVKITLWKYRVCDTCYGMVVSSFRARL